MITQDLSTREWEHNIINHSDTYIIMEMRLESLLANWDEKIPGLFISLVNAVALAGNETELRQAMARLSENEDFNRLFAYGYGSSHLWLKQRLVTDSSKVMDNRLIIVEF